MLSSTCTTVQSGLIRLNELKLLNRDFLGMQYVIEINSNQVDMAHVHTALFKFKPS